MKTRLCIPLALVVSGLCARGVSAANFAYVRATSQRDGKAATYHPLNLMDEDPETIWCEGADGLGEGEEIQFSFKKSQKIDRIVIASTSKTGRLVLKVHISDGMNSLIVRLGNETVERDISPPMQGSTYTLTIEQVGGPNKGAQTAKDVTCLADAVFFYRNRLWGGRVTKEQLKYDKRADRILGRWAGGALGAPEGWITYAIDGTWSWEYRPLLGGKPDKGSGEFRFRGNRLLMRKGEVGRWADMRLRIRRIKVDPDEMGAPLGDYTVIEINRALGDKLAGPYNDAEF